MICIHLCKSIPAAILDLVHAPSEHHDDGQHREAQHVENQRRPRAEKTVDAGEARLTHSEDDRVDESEGSRAMKLRHADPSTQHRPAEWRNGRRYGLKILSSRFLCRSHNCGEQLVFWILAILFLVGPTFS